MAVASLQIENLTSFIELIKSSRTTNEKLSLLNKYFNVEQTFQNILNSFPFSKPLTIEYEWIIKSLILIDQAERVLHLEDLSSFNEKKFEQLIEHLLKMEKFYQHLGGILGYHFTTLKLLHERKNVQSNLSISYQPFHGIDISKDEQEVRKATICALENLDKMAEIYPIGGAADRLKLQDEKTGHFLPAARLVFCGKTLLEQLIIDLQTREYLHYKLFGKQVRTPIALMTSKEKDNDAQIRALFEEYHWFGRKQELFFFFVQPLVPTINQNGQWCLQGPMQLLLKPGGHGVIWKVAQEEGVFQWLYEQGRSKAIVRQINNLAAGIDYGLLAFAGMGIKDDKVFGFSSCPREVKTSEGINVLIEKRHANGYEYLVTNIEYCDFEKFKIVDEPESANSNYSKYLSNTNILFVDLKSLEKVIEKNPIPGMLVNLKKMHFFNHQGTIQEEEVIRLESTMQNVADSFVEFSEKPLKEKNQLKTYLTYNRRHKTIAPIKKEYVSGTTFNETPEGCYLNLLQCARELLVEHCKIELPELTNPLDFLLRGPNFIFLYHPALGPLFSVIGQKLRGGHFALHSECQLEIAELDVENLHIKGSLLVRAIQPLGHLDQNILCYSEETGKCTLKNVHVDNQGIDRTASNQFWKSEVVRKESCQILLHGNGEFHAENITLKGNLQIEVPAGMRMIAKEKNGKIVFHQEKIDAPTWHWKYFIDKDFQIKIVRV